MPSARKVGKWVVFGLLGVAALVVLLRVGVGVYLGTSGGRAVVAEQLGSLIGLPVEVENIDLGSRTSSVKFRVTDPALGTGPEADILTVEEASADVTLAGILTGNSTPSELHLRGVSLSLRIGEDGKILTSLPEPKPSDGGETKIPLVTVENAKAKIVQEGRPPFTLAGISLRAEPSGDKVVITGAIDDPGWGKWKVSGEIDVPSESGWVELATDDAPLQTEKLSSIPYIPMSVWENAKPEGRGKAVGRFEVGPGDQFAYDIKVQPQSAALALPPADVTLQDVTGVVHVHDDKVEVVGADGQPRATAALAGGNVKLSGVWDYGEDTAVLDPLNIEVEKLAVRELPDSWGLDNVGGKLPGKLTLEDGFLTGAAKLRIVIPEEGAIETYGGGAGKITIPGFAGGSLELGVELGGDGKKLGFTQATPEKKADPEDKADPKDKADAMGHLAPPPHAVRTIRVTITNERELAALLAVLAHQPADMKEKVEPEEEESTNLDATLTLKDIDIAQLLEQLEIEIPYRLSGKASLEAKLAVPLGGVTSSAAYRITGTLTSPEMTFEGLTVRGLTTQVDYQDGKVTLTKFEGTLVEAGKPDAPAGTFRGTASAAIDPAGNVSATLTLDKIPVAAVLGAVPDLNLEAGGVVSGKATFQAPFEKLDDPTTWTGTAGLTSDELTFAGRTATDVSFNLVLADGTATLKDTRATIEGIPLAAGGTLALTDTYVFSASLNTTGTSLTDFRKLVPELELPLPVRGTLDTESKVSGTLSPLAFSGSGTIKSEKLILGYLTVAKGIEARWELTDERVKLTKLDAAIFDGTISGSLDYPFAPDETGSFSLTFDEIDSAKAVRFVPGFDRKIAGDVSGKLTGKIVPVKESDSRLGDFDLTLTAPELKIQVISPTKLFPVQELSGKVSIQNGLLDYRLNAKLEGGGTVELKRTLPKENEEGAEPGQGRGSLRLTDIDLGRLAGNLGIDELAQLRGTLSLSFDFSEDFSDGTGRVVVSGLAWGRDAAPSEITGVILVRDNVLEIRDLGGPFAHGLLRARGRVRLDDPARNYLVVAINRADAPRLFAPVPELADTIDGTVSVVVRTTFGRSFRGSGEITLDNGTLAGVALPEFRIPFDYTISPTGYGRLSVRNAAARAGTGRATGTATVSWGTGTRVEGRVRFIDLPLRSISPAIGNNPLFGSGTVTGRFDLAGSNVRSADDLVGRLVANLNNTSVREVPLLRQATPYLNPIGATKPFDSGDVQGTLSRGVFRIERLALANPGVQLFAAGTITLEGRLDLDVVAHTGSVGGDSPAMRALRLAIPLVGPIPLVVIKDVSDFLSNRTIKLTITGTTASPQVRVNTAALLREEAIRFLLSRYAPPSVGEALGYGSGAGVAGGLLWQAVDDDDN